MCEQVTKQPDCNYMIIGGGGGDDGERATFCKGQKCYTKWKAPF